MSRKNIAISSSLEVIFSLWRDLPESDLVEILAHHVVHSLSVVYDDSHHTRGSEVAHPIRLILKALIKFEHHTVQIHMTNT